MIELLKKKKDLVNYIITESGNFNIDRIITINNNYIVIKELHEAYYSFNKYYEQITVIRCVDIHNFSYLETKEEKDQWVKELKDEFKESLDRKKAKYPYYIASIDKEDEKKDKKENDEKNEIEKKLEMFNNFIDQLSMDESDAKEWKNMVVDMTNDLKNIKEDDNLSDNIKKVWEDFSNKVSNKVLEDVNEIKSENEKPLNDVHMGNLLKGIFDNDEIEPEEEHVIEDKAKSK